MKSKLIVLALIALAVVGFLAYKQITKENTAGDTMEVAKPAEETSTMEKEEGLSTESEVEFESEGTVEGESIDKEIESLNEVMDGASPDDFSESGLSDL